MSAIGLWIVGLEAFALHAFIAAYILYRIGEIIFEYLLDLIESWTA